MRGMDSEFLDVSKAAHALKMLLIARAPCAFNLPATPPSVEARSTLQMAGVKGYYSINDVLLVKRCDEDVSRFHEKERERWRVVYDEEYKEAPQEFYPGDRVKIVSEEPVKTISNPKGMEGVVTHYEFDDGYEACQTCSTSCPVTVMLEE